MADAVHCEDDPRPLIRVLTKHRTSSADARGVPAALPAAEAEVNLQRNLISRERGEAGHGPA